MSDSEKQPNSPIGFTGEVRFDYVKSTLFRVIHVDGAHGGARVNGSSIHMALFNERNPIPKSETYQVANGKLGALTASDRREAIIREVEVDAIMDLTTAKALREWLDRAILSLETLAAMEKSGAGTNG